MLGINQAAAIHRQISYFAAGLLQMPAGMQHGMVLDAGSNDVVAGTGQSRNRQIVGLSSTAGEDNF